MMLTMNISAMIDKYWHVLTCQHVFIPGYYLLLGYIWWSPILIQEDAVGVHNTVGGDAGKVRGSDECHIGCEFAVDSPRKADATQLSDTVPSLINGKSPTDRSRAAGRWNYSIGGECAYRAAHCGRGAAIESSTLWACVKET